jgi:hypothetical protein
VNGYGVRIDVVPLEHTGTPADALRGRRWSFPDRCVDAISLLLRADTGLSVLAEAMDSFP